MDLSVHIQNKDFQHLKGLLAQEGCFAPKIAFYTRRFIILVTFLILNILFLLRCDIFPAQILGAVCLAFIFGQIGLLSHDIVHRQAWKTLIADMLLGNLLLGISYSWWHDKHNKKHHRYTNQPGLDEDIEAHLLAFTQEQASSKGGFEKFIIRHQIYYLFFLFMVLPFEMYFDSIKFLMSRKVRYRILEIALLITHLFVLLFLLMSHMSISKALILFVISRGLFGVYIGSIFVVNHTGMPILDKSDEIDYFSSQIITSRNIKSHPLTDFIMGGLNAQIEHHLFPQIPRPNLQKSRKIIKDFCNNHNVSYYEVGFWESFQEVLTYLNSLIVYQGKINMEAKDG